MPKTQPLTYEQVEMQVKSEKAVCKVLYDSMREAYNAADGDESVVVYIQAKKEYEQRKAASDSLVDGLRQMRVDELDRNCAPHIAALEKVFAEAAELAATWQNVNYADIPAFLDQFDQTLAKGNTATNGLRHLAAYTNLQGKHAGLTEWVRISRTRYIYPPPIDAPTP